MSKEKKRPRFLRRLFGFGAAKPKAAEAEARDTLAELGAPPPAGPPATATGVRPPDERPPGTREKGTPDVSDLESSQSEVPEPGSDAKEVPKEPPPAGPAAPPGVLRPEERPPGTRKKAHRKGPTTPVSEGLKPDDDKQA